MPTYYLFSEALYCEVPCIFSVVILEIYSVYLGFIVTVLSYASIQRANTRDRLNI